MISKKKKLPQVILKASGVLLKIMKIKMFYDTIKKK